MRIAFSLLCAICLVGFLTSCTGISRKPSDKNLLDIDSNAIQGWEVIPSRDLKIHRYSVTENKGQWQVQLPSGETGQADKEYVRRSLHHLANLKAQELIRAPEESWDTMGVTDKGTHLKVMHDGKTALDLIIGKMFFTNNRTTYYVRPAGENSIYTLPLYLEGSLIADPSRVRQKDLVPFSIAFRIIGKSFPHCLVSAMIRDVSIYFLFIGRF